MGIPFALARGPLIVAELGFAALQPERTTVGHNDAVPFDPRKQHTIQASALLNQTPHALDIAVIANGIKERSIWQP
jgi:hypothetical protein